MCYTGSQMRAAIGCASGLLRRGP